MGYRRMNKRDLWVIYRRWRAGHPLSQIAEAERRDRKTVRELPRNRSHFCADHYAHASPVERKSCV